MTVANASILDENFNFSDKAAIKIAELIEEENNPDLNFRIYITGGGCSGFQYGITFDDVLHDDDTVIEKSCPDSTTIIKLVIDSMSYPYLKSAQIDFKDSPEQFIISNPDAKTTCGCGSSFTLDDD